MSQLQKFGFDLLCKIMVIKKTHVSLCGIENESGELELVKKKTEAFIKTGVKKTRQYVNM